MATASSPSSMMMTGNGFAYAFIGQKGGGAVAALARDDLESFAVGPHQKRLQDAEPSNGGQKVVYVAGVFLRTR